MRKWRGPPPLASFWRLEPEAAVRPVLVIVLDEVAKDSFEMVRPRTSVQSRHSSRTVRT
jgi:hypothetical protein